MENKKKKRFGDRKDATLIRDMDAIHICAAHLYDKRTDNEAYISETIELKPLYDWIEKHPDDELKYTFFHIIVAAVLKVLIERPKLNRFIANKRYYQKDERVAAFIVKRQFTDESKEGMANVRATEDDTIFTIHEKIKAQIIPCKKGLNTNTEDTMEIFPKLPFWLQKIVFKFISFIAERGWLPLSAVKGDANHASVFLTNLGSIGLKCGYHHLANYGTNSAFVVIGQKKMTPFYDEKGNVTMKETLDLGLTIDERIADGYYFAKSIKILKYILENPKTLESKFGEKVNLD